MTVSIFLARTFSVYLLVVGVSMLMHKRYYQGALRDMLQNPGVLVLTAIFTLILGIVVVLFHNIWVNDWRVVVTLLAWLTLLKGLVRMLYPAAINTMTDWVSNDRFYVGSMLLCLALGGYLAYKGFAL